MSELRRNRKKGFTYYFSLPYSNKNLWKIDIIPPEALLDSGENELSSIKEVSLQEGTYVLSHQPHLLPLYSSSVPRMYFYVQIDFSVSPRLTGVGGLGIKRYTVGKPALPHAHLQISLLHSVGFSETQKMHWTFP